MEVVLNPDLCICHYFVLFVSANVKGGVPVRIVDRLATCCVSAFKRVGELTAVVVFFLAVRNEFKVLSSPPRFLHNDECRHSSSDSIRVCVSDGVLCLRDVLRSRAGVEELISCFNLGDTLDKRAHVHVRCRPTVQYLFPLNDVRDVDPIAFFRVTRLLLISVGPNRLAGVAAPVNDCVPNGIFIFCQDNKGGRLRAIYYMFIAVRVAFNGYQNE